MIITRISKQKKKSDRYNVYVDEIYSFSISANDLLKSSISTGIEINKQDLKNYKRQASKSFLLDACLIYLSLRPHSTKEIYQYIKRKIYSKPELKEHIGKEIEQISKEIINYLSSKSYLNDKDFTTWLTTQRNNSKTPKSISHIKYELYQKGISAEIIEEVLKDQDIPNEREKANLIAGKKFKQLKSRNKSNLEIKKALYTHLSQKGFSWEIIQSIVDTYITPQYNID